MLAVPPALSGNVEAVVMQWMQCPRRWMKSILMEDSGPKKVDAVMLQWLQYPLLFPEFRYSALAEVAVSHKLDLVCCDGRCSAHGGGCSETVLTAGHVQCKFSCMQCPCSGGSATCSLPDCGSSAHAADAVSHKVETYVVMKDAVATEVDAVRLC